jgi:hypothetical protein
MLLEVLPRGQSNERGHTQHIETYRDPELLPFFRTVVLVVFVKSISLILRSRAFLSLYQYGVSNQ